LEIQVNAPGDTLASFPEPSADATSYGGSNDGNSGGGGGTTQVGSGGASANGSQNIGLPTAPRWTSSLPYDEPLHTGDGAQGGEVPFIFIDRTTSSLVIKTTKEKQKMVAQYLANVDKPEPQIMIETKVVEISMGELLEYGTDWSDALGKGITVNWEGARVNLADVFSGGGSGTWTAFLTIPETSITIRAFQEMDKGSVMNMPRTMTRSGVPVSISSTITDATPAYQIATGTGGTGAVSTPSGFNTFTTGLTIDVVPQILENGMIDINVNPTVANQVGERTIEANVQTGVPKQTIPIISSRSLTTSAIVPSGMTIMLGGIVETKNTDSSGGIPILSQIPVLGKTVFGNTNKKDSRKTLIVFLTPKVIYPDEYQKVWTSEEEWRAMIDGNRADIQTYNDRIPQPLEIRKALPIKDALNQRETPKTKRK
jgi:general secretion pathway protein D